MQWSPDRNASFSRAESARLYAPVINDSIYGHQSINVEAQEKSPFSLLNWMKRLVQVRKQHHAFGRGSIEFLQPESPHVLAYIRQYEDDTILVVNNLSGAAQAVQLDLARFSGCVPVEMLGHTEFLPIDETPYALTLSPYGFFWFAIRSRAAGEEGPEVDESLAREWAEQDLAVLESRESVAALAAAIPTEWLTRQRWFRGKGREVVAVELDDHAVVAPEHGPRWIVAVVQVRFAEGEPDTYLLPLSLRPPRARGAPTRTDFAQANCQANNRPRGCTRGASRPSTVRPVNGSPQCEQTCTARASWSHVVWCNRTGGPSGPVAHLSPQLRSAMMTGNRSLPFCVRWYS
jgi:maltose alpha-D-glucosyltransferase/alpha-amylase